MKLCFKRRKYLPLLSISELSLFDIASPSVPGYLCLQIPIGHYSKQLTYYWFFRSAQKYLTIVAFVLLEC